MYYLVNADECLGCGICTGACRKEAIAVEEDFAVIDQDKCVKCGQCAKICPAGAIEKKEA